MLKINSSKNLDDQEKIDFVLEKAFVETKLIVDKHPLNKKNLHSMKNASFLL